MKNNLVINDHIIKRTWLVFAFFIFQTYVIPVFAQKKVAQPNVIFIYADDLGYGDVGAYGATKVKTPHIDKLANDGLLFSKAYATSATCTPSRYSLLTGTYAWRKKDTGIATGDASMIIDPNNKSIADVFKAAGYKTTVLGKWHLGLGNSPGPKWNHEIKPGPLEIGFDYSFIIPATLDRVPTVFVKNHHVSNLDLEDSLLVSYTDKVGNEPTGKSNPELLKMKYSYGHDQTIVNGISRIGYMSGAHAARWKDEELAPIFIDETRKFISENQKQPFFIYFPSSDIHVPRAPHPMFVGKSGMGARGDAILQLDWSVGQIVNILDSLQLSDNTLIVFSSDNGPVLDDGYEDQAVELLNGHTPAGKLRGGKYSKFEAGTRVPFIVKWPLKIKANTQSAAMISQVDLFATMAELFKQKLDQKDATDSYPMLNTLLGNDKLRRDHIILQNQGLAIIKGDWKYIHPSNGKPLNKSTNTETGNNPLPQLYNLEKDPEEKNNVAGKNPEMVKSLAHLLHQIENNPNYKQSKNN